MKSNLHTHTTWCDGRDAPETMVLAALARGFGRLGFSPHASWPEEEPGTLSREAGPRYAAEIRALAARYAGRIEILCGVEADFIPGATDPDRARYAAIAPDYVIGSVHWVVAPDGGRVPVDHTPEKLVAGVRAHFGGDCEAFVRAYFAAERAMVASFDFDVLGHPDLCRKFNGRLGFFSESAAWYREELVRTADAVAASGKTVEINTGAISRGWMDDAYPSAEFRALLVARGVKLTLNSDAHAAEAIDCAFDRFALES